jgi:hypothetical protein
VGARHCIDKSLHSTNHLEPALRNIASCKLELERLWAGTTTGEKKMNYQQDVYQQSSWQNPMQWSGNSHTPGTNFGLGQAAYGLQSGPYGTGQLGGGWGQRQLSPLDISEVVRQMVPLLPQILAQSQQQPLAAYGYGINQRQLSPQDINEVVRQLLPILPQIIGAIQQGQSPMHAAAIYGNSRNMASASAIPTDSSDLRASSVSSARRSRLRSVACRVSDNCRRRTSMRSCVSWSPRFPKSSGTCRLMANA